MARRAIEVEMQHPGFFERAGPFALDVVAKLVGGTVEGVSPNQAFVDVKPLSSATPSDVSFFENKKYLDQLAATRAGACLVAKPFAHRLPAGTVPIVVRAPYRAFAQSLALFYPEAMRSKVAMADAGEPLVHPTARIEAGARVEPGAIVGREAWIGRGTVIASGAVVGYRVTIGRDGFIGPGASIVHAMIGNGVIIHGGVRIGQDGFGFAMGADGHLKVPQIGRVIIQDNVEIGANTAIDRGALEDTVIGEGTKIDNLVQIGHNVKIGRHCVIVGQVGIAGSAELGDGVVIGGHAGVAGHIKVGSRVQIAGSSHVKDDVPDGAKIGGTPAKPFRQWARELAAIDRLGRAPAADRAAGASDAD